MNKQHLPLFPSTDVCCYRIISHILRTPLVDCCILQCLFHLDVIKLSSIDYLSLQINIHHHNLVSHIVSSFLMHLARAQTHRNIYTISSDMAPIYTYLYYDSNCNIFIYLRQEENIICNSKVMLMGGGSNLILSISQTRRIDATSHNHNTIFVFTGIYPKVN